MELKIARIRMGLTQKQLCQKLHISPNKLVDLEHGRIQNVKVRDLQRIAEVMEVPVFELFPELENRLGKEVD